jgi:streptogramin lyase
MDLMPRPPGDRAQIEIVDRRWRPSAAAAYVPGMRRLIAASVVGGVLVAQATAAGGGRLPGAVAFKACAGAGPYWPTMTLALDRGSAWVACKEQARVIHIDTKTGRVGPVLRFDAPVTAVAAGYGSVWALDSSSTLTRIDPASGRVTRRTALPASAAYNIWLGGGSVWVADDQGRQVIRLSRGGEVQRRIAVGDGPSDMAFGGASAWVINHRDRKLFRIDLATNASTLVSVVPGDAPERMVMLAGSLWITGRGTDLLQVDPNSGSVKATIEIGASGIDVAAVAGALWVPVRSSTVDATGLPTMQALRRVSAKTRRVQTISRATGRVDVHGIGTQGRFVWLADNHAGVLYRFSG